MKRLIRKIVADAVALGPCGLNYNVCIGLINNVDKQCTSDSVVKDLGSNFAYYGLIDDSLKFVVEAYMYNTKVNGADGKKVGLVFAPISPEGIIGTPNEVEVKDITGGSDIQALFNNGITTNEGLQLTFSKKIKSLDNLDVKK